MNYPTHKLFGTALATFTSSTIYHNIPQVQNLLARSPVPSSIHVLVFVVTAYKGSTAADIDSKSSKESAKHPYISRIIRHFSVHRGFTHYPSTLVLAGILSFLFYMFVLDGRLFVPLLHLYLSGISGYLLGCFSHIFLDSFSSRGVAWFAPFSSYRVHIPIGIRVIRKPNKSRKVSLKYLNGNSYVDYVVVIGVSLLLLWLSLARIVSWN